MMFNIGLSDQYRAGSCAILNTLLAHEYILYTKTLNYHWNVKGPHFHSLHELFNNQYSQLFDVIDSVAERVTTLGHRALGTLQEFIDISPLKETPHSNNLSAQEMIQVLMEGHASIIRQLRTDAQQVIDQYKDLGTNNFLINLIEKHEKMYWVLRSHLEK